MIPSAIEARLATISRIMTARGQAQTQPAAPFPGGRTADFSADRQSDVHRQTAAAPSENAAAHDTAEPDTDDYSQTPASALPQILLDMLDTRTNDAAEADYWERQLAQTEAQASVPRRSEPDWSQLLGATHHAEPKSSNGMQMMINDDGTYAVSTPEPTAAVPVPAAADYGDETALASLLEALRQRASP